MKTRDIDNFSQKQVYVLPEEANIYQKDIYQKINSRNYLNIYTTEYELKTRINTPNDIHFNATKIVLPEATNIDDNYWVEMNTFNDSINEVVKVPKVALTITSITDMSNYQRNINEMI